VSEDVRVYYCTPLKRKTFDELIDADYENQVTFGELTEAVERTLKELHEIAPESLTFDTELKFTVNGGRTIHVAMWPEQQRARESRCESVID
jgi:hypothetical protein